MARRAGVAGVLDNAEEVASRRTDADLVVVSRLMGLGTGSSGALGLSLSGRAMTWGLATKSKPRVVAVVAMIVSTKTPMTYETNRTYPSFPAYLCHPR